MTFAVDWALSNNYLSIYQLAPVFTAISNYSLQLSQVPSLLQGLHPTIIPVPNKPKI